MTDRVKPVASAKLLAIAQDVSAQKEVDAALAGAIVASIVGSTISLVAVIVGAPLLPLAIAAGAAVGVLLLLPQVRLASSKRRTARQAREGAGA